MAWAWVSRVSRREGLQRRMQKLLGVMSEFTILMGDGFTDMCLWVFMSKLTKLYTLNMVSLFYVSYTE